MTCARVAMLVEGTFIPSREGATRRFCGLARSLSSSGVFVSVLHCYRGWSDMELIKAEPFRTYFIPPGRFYDDVNLLAELLVRDAINTLSISDFETVLRLGIPLKRRLPTLHLVLEAHDVATNFMRSLGAAADRCDQLCLQETQAFGAVDAIFCFTDRDLRSIRKMMQDGRDTGLLPDRPNANNQLPTVTRVPFGCDMKSNPTAIRGRESKCVLFVGNIYHQPNARAVTFLRTEVYPAVAAIDANISFRIVGDVPPALRAQCEAPAFYFIGMVPDLDVVCASSTLAVSPIFHGSGIKVKILDYCASGLPILCTRESLEGIVTDDSQLNAFVIEDDPQKYAQRICELIGDANRRQALASAARALVSLQNWERIAPEIVEMYQRVNEVPSRPVPTYLNSTEPILTQYFLTDYLEQRRFAESAGGPLSKVMVGGWSGLEAIA